MMMMIVILMIMMTIMKKVMVTANGTDGGTSNDVIDDNDGESQIWEKSKEIVNLGKYDKTKKLPKFNKPIGKS